MFKGFKEFVLRGNVIDLAVAVVIGAAFTAIVNSIVTNLINPLINLFFEADRLDEALILTVGNSQFGFGAVIGATINFLIVAAVVYFAFVQPMNRLRRGKEDEKAAAPPAPTEQQLLTEIRDLLAKQAKATK